MDSKGVVGGMAAVVSIVGAVIAGYLSLLTLMLFYLGFSSLGADAREAEIGAKDSAQYAG